MAIDPRFFAVIPSTAASLADRAGCELRGDGERPIVGAAPVSVAGNGDLTFLSAEQDADDRAPEQVTTTVAVCVCCRHVHNCVTQMLEQQRVDTQIPCLVVSGG